MKRVLDSSKITIGKYGRRVAALSTLGAVGATIFIAYGLYRTARGMDNIDWDNLSL